MSWTFTLLEGIGAVGMTCIFIAFTLNELDILDDNMFSFNILNFLGGGILLWYSIKLQSFVFLTLNIFWVLVAGGKTLKLAFQNKNKSF